MREGHRHPEGEPTQASRPTEEVIAKRVNAVLTAGPAGEGTTPETQEMLAWLEQLATDDEAFAKEKDMEQFGGNYVGWEQEDFATAAERVRERLAGQE